MALDDVRLLQPDLTQLGPFPDTWYENDHVYEAGGIEFLFDVTGTGVVGIGSPHIDFCYLEQPTFRSEPELDQALGDFRAVADLHCPSSTPDVIGIEPTADPETFIVSVDTWDRLIFDRGKGLVYPHDGPEGILGFGWRACHHEVFLGTTDH